MRNALRTQRPAWLVQVWNVMLTVFTFHVQYVPKEVSS